MSRQSFKRGDRVRVTLEGEITRVMDIEPGSEEVELRVENPSGRASYVYTDMATVEKVEPKYEVFGPGDVVRDKDHPVGWFAIGDRGYYDSFCGGMFYSWSANLGRDYFTSERFERVSLG